MALTYNLAATDLITLLNSTGTQQTTQAVLDSLVSAFGTSIITSTASVTPLFGPSDTSGNGVNPTTTTLTSGTQFAIVTQPQSTSTYGASFSSSVAGSQTTKTDVNVVSPFGGVVIAAGDQYVTLTDSNTGGQAPDTLIGGAGDERLVSGGGSNVLVGGTGLNTLIGGTGADTLIGGAQSRLVSGTGANVLKSSTLSGGADTLIGGGGADSLQAQAGNNRLIAGAGPNTLVGGSGNDTLFTGLKTDVSVGAGAARTNVVSNGVNTITAGTNADTVYIGYGVSSVTDSIVGSTGTLRVVDLSGQNTITAGAGAATVVLGSGTQSNTSNQTITSGAGGVRVVTTESSAYYSNATAAGGVNTVKFSDTGQTLTINDTTGTSVTLVFGDGHPAVKI